MIIGERSPLKLPLPQPWRDLATSQYHVVADPRVAGPQMFNSVLVFWGRRRSDP